MSLLQTRMLAGMHLSRQQRLPMGVLSESLDLGRHKSTWARSTCCMPPTMRRFPSGRVMTDGYQRPRSSWPTTAYCCVLGWSTRMLCMPAVRKGGFRLRLSPAGPAALPQNDHHLKADADAAAVAGALPATTALCMAVSACLDAAHGSAAKHVERFQQSD